MRRLKLNRDLEACSFDWVNVGLMPYIWDINHRLYMPLFANAYNISNDENIV